jgi:hypothetical protein
MYVKVTVSFEPVLNRGVFMCRIVMHSEVQIKVLGGVRGRSVLRNATTRRGDGIFRSRDNLVLQITQSCKSVMVPWRI